MQCIFFNKNNQNKHFDKRYFMRKFLARKIYQARKANCGINCHTVVYLFRAAFSPPPPFPPPLPLATFWKVSVCPPSHVFCTQPLLFIISVKGKVFSHFVLQCVPHLLISVPIVPFSINDRVRKKALTSFERDKLMSKLDTQLDYEVCILGTIC